MKKILCVALAALALASPLAGCGGKGSAGTGAGDGAGPRSADGAEPGAAAGADDGAEPGAAAGADAGGGTLVVGMELAYPPFETKDAAGNPSGVSVDIAKEFAQYIGKDIRIEDIAWGGLIPSLQTGKVDMVISSMTIRDDRLEEVDFSDPYANALLAILSNISSGIGSVDDLNKPGRKIAVKNGTSGHFYARENLMEAELVVLDDESACVMEVSQGKADGFIYDQLTIYRNWQNNLSTTSAVFIPFQDAEKWGVAVQKGNAGLVGQLNDFIKKFREEGGYDRLTQKYLAEEKAAFDELGFKWFFDMG